MTHEAKTRRGKPYKVWVMIRDADDDELRVVPKAHAENYTKNYDYAGSWSIVMRGAKDEVRVMAKMGYTYEWIDFDGHFHYTNDPPDRTEGFI